MTKEIINTCLHHFEPDLLEEIYEYGTIKKVSANHTIVKQGDYIKHLPIIIEGRVKMYTETDDVAFLLYFLGSGQPCIFSFNHIKYTKPISFTAVTEVDSVLLLLPLEKVDLWVNKYISLATLLMESYERHYEDLLETTKQLTCLNLEERLYKYLTKRAEFNSVDFIQSPHQEIANDLGTSREVVSRLMSKLKKDNKVVQEGRIIRIIDVT